MFDFSDVSMDKLVIHKVGNKVRDEGFIMSPGMFELADANLEELLLKYFLSSFKEKATYKFFHEADIHLNELYMYVSAIFINQENFYEQSIHILKHLYETSSHPQIKSGEVYVTYFSGCLFKEQKVDAIGIFKTENKESYLKVEGAGNDFVMRADTGINIKKLDKGCVVFNIDSMDGYRVAIVDNVNKNGNEAAYWKEEFLRVADVHDEYFQTKNYLNLCCDFAETIYGPSCNADKKEQVVFMNEAITYFNNNSQFNLDSFVQNVVKKSDLIEQFKEHQQSYEMNQGVNYTENFTISSQAVKTVKRKFKNLIKLDTDIEIKLKASMPDAGPEQYIERGYDSARNMYYYKIYFNAEE